ncbi:MAG TPA: (d)CMP kinase [Planctomycetia bacterium]|nr:(d)CMP kinase [Planctomycetia bacterium]
MIVTIDGPAGAGKSTVARLLAQRLEFQFLDTGALYRTVAYAALRDGVAADDEPRLQDLLGGLQPELDGSRVRLEGVDVTQAIRTPEITRLVKEFAESAPVREFLTARSRAIGVLRDTVTEGRDQGTVVFPEAECKFFVTADETARARRRWEDLKARGIDVPFERLVAEQAERDARDSGRSLAPLVQAADAERIDTTSLAIPAVVDLLEAKVRARMPGRRPA